MSWNPDRLVVTVRRRPSSTEELAMWLLVAPLLLAAAVIYVLFLVARAIWRWHRSATAARVQRRAELVARCDQQHEWSLVGDERGVYGEYPPVRAA